jgi:hypothetical protein
MSAMTRKEWLTYLGQVWEQIYKERTMLDNVPITNPERDKAWGNFIKRKTVKAFMADRADFRFPLDGSYELWCVAWEKAWAEGFKAGYEEKGK